MADWDDAGSADGSWYLGGAKPFGARQVEAAMKVSKTEMARRMQTSRAALDRLLVPANEAVTLSTLRKTATAVGREIRLELV